MSENLHRRATDHGLTKWSMLKGTLAVIGYSLLTAIVTLTLATALGGPSRELANRVDQNADYARRATAAIVCILRLGVNPQAPPRTDENVNTCLAINGLPSVDKGES